MTPPSRLTLPDLGRLGASGLRTRPLRVILSALGIAIGIAAMLAVVGISTSSQAELNRTLDRLGTNLLVAGPGKTLFGAPAQLPTEAVEMVDRIGPVQSASATANLGAHVYRNDHIPRGQTNSIAVLATRLDLLGTVGGSVRTGDWLSPATARYPAVVLGSKAAKRLDIRQPGLRVWLAGQWFSVVGILDPVPLAKELDTAALIGWASATAYAEFDGHPTTIYCRSAEDQVEAVRAVLAATASPGHPEEVAVSRPSDALAAQRATDQAFTGLLLGLGAVALLVGGVGVANTMIISVLERRSEIGLRRSLGATRGHVRLQFLAESLLLSAIGGAGGVLLGVAVTGAYASTQHWPLVVPAWAFAGGLTATLLIGGVAGLYPAIRAARLAPTEALSTP
ncbi:MAG: ABC transporter permease [Hamadaea sp.]|uniref:ABC transporter permease n=1 Tax=Hamadaea sp. TaxID=2024425 RepID=UPI0017B134C8|nr:ABC transporter permease [Hamadaea sp.]NUR74046.1 ABC transporter permease [Hamadaea sp.]NUT23550.1 ABC transporter permease [Hamadaea sp.]